jgi:predicted RNase H-like HicB family nuclease
MATVTFHVQVNEEDDGTYWAEVKELPGCFASGFSIEELKEAAFEAIQMWLPEGITLGNPTWKVVEDKTARGGKSAKRPARRQMLVCA